MEENKYCTNCGSQIDVNTDICPECSSKQVRPIIKETKYCPNCASQIDEKAEICPNCGVRQPTPVNYQHTIGKEKNPVLAAILSLLVVGLGQLYNGELDKAVLFFIAAVFAGLTLYIFIGFILVPIVWAYAAYDAYITAENINGGY